MQASQKPKITIMKKLSYKVLFRGFYSQTPNTKYQKKPKEKAITGDKMGRKPKRDKGSQKVKSRTSEQWCRKGQFRRLQISQPTKFCRLRKFCSLALFLLVLSCSYELNLDSTWLSRIPIYGIKSLQKQQNSPQNLISSFAKSLTCQLGYLG